MKCCWFSSFVAERDVGSARGFDMTLGKCSRCGKPWMSVFCVAASTSGYEPVKPADVERIRNIQDPLELKQFMKGWVGHLA